MHLERVMIVLLTAATLALSTNHRGSYTTPTSNARPCVLLSDEDQSEIKTSARKQPNSCRLAVAPYRDLPPNEFVNPLLELYLSVQVIPGGNL